MGGVHHCDGDLDMDVSTRTGAGFPPLGGEAVDQEFQR